MKIIKSERQKGCRKDEMVKRQSTRKHKGLTHMATELQLEETKYITLEDQVNTILENTRNLVIAAEVRSLEYCVLGSDLKFLSKAGILKSDVYCSSCY